jgi:hypothetical protein
MTTYIALFSLTDAGIKAAKDAASALADGPLRYRRNALSDS